MATCDICGRQGGVLNGLSKVNVGGMALQICGRCSKQIVDLRSPSKFPGAYAYLEECLEAQAMTPEVEGCVRSAVAATQMAFESARNGVYTQQAGADHANGEGGYDPRPRYEYRVKRLPDMEDGRMDIAEMVNVLNDMGERGWRLRQAFSNEVRRNTTGSAAINESVLIFEREAL